MTRKPWTSTPAAASRSEAAGPRVFRLRRSHRGGCCGPPGLRSPGRRRPSTPADRRSWDRVRRPRAHAHRASRRSRLVPDQPILHVGGAVNGAGINAAHRAAGEILGHPAPDASHSRPIGKGRKAPMRAPSGSPSRRSPPRSRCPVGGEDRGELRVRDCERRSDFVVQWTPHPFRQGKREPVLAAALDLFRELGPRRSTSRALPRPTTRLSGSVRAHSTSSWSR